MNELKHLFDSMRPYARFYSANGVTVQIHTRQINGLRFGRVGWRLTASVCDSAGATIEDDSGLQILQGANGAHFTHEITVQFDAPENLGALLETARQDLAYKACNASAVWKQAKEIG